VLVDGPNCPAAPAMHLPATALPEGSPARLSTAWLPAGLLQGQAQQPPGRAADGG
jgi:hypothetical protein